MAIAPSNPQVIYAEVQAIDPIAGCGVLQLLGTLEILGAAERHAV